jgi:hypothetical protein
MEPSPDPFQAVKTTSDSISFLLKFIRKRGQGEKGGGRRSILSLLIISAGDGGRAEKRRRREKKSEDGRGAQ